MSSFFLNGIGFIPHFVPMFEWAKVTVKAQYVKDKKEKLNKRIKPISKEEVKNPLKNLNGSTKSSLVVAKTNLSF